MKATLLLDGEQVERCRECGKPSTGSLGGRDGWKLVRVRPGAMLLVEICPECYALQGPVIRMP